MVLPLLALLLACPKTSDDGHPPPPSDPQPFTPGTAGAEPHPVGAIEYRGPADGPVRNVVLVIGDGMGLTHISAGLIANQNQLVLENFPVVGLQKTHETNLEITDSSAAATAMATGVKTTNGAVGVDADGKPAETIIERMHARGLSTGLVSSSEVLHATPAAFATHTANRTDYGIIAAQMSEAPVDVLLGTGRKWFEKHESGDLTQKMVDRGYTYVTDLDALAETTAPPVLGLFEDERWPYRVDGRDRVLRITAEKAMELLATDDDGYFLMVEASQVDWGGHDTKIDAIVGEVLDLDYTLEGILRSALKTGDTLVLVTADHETGGLSLTKGDAKTGAMEAHFSTSHHTATMVPVFAWGPRAQRFTGIYDNTELHGRMVEVLESKTP